VIDAPVFEPGSRTCTFEDAAILCTDDGWIALCPEHGSEFEVERARFKEAPTQDRWRVFEKVWIAAHGGAEKAAERMRGYAARKRLLGHG
jgi:hypothetical protein